jgi:ATP-binding protein involved in chromosome partitioning
MRIAIPMSGDRLDPHFGHCAKFALIDVAPESKNILAKQEIPAPEHQHGLLPPWLEGQGVTLVIAGGMGAHARSLLQNASIEVITGAPAEAPEVLVRQYLEGALESVERLCDHSCHH